MQFWFLYTSYNKFGGIETLMWRMHDWLESEGHQVTIITDCFAVAREHLPAAIKVLELGDQYGQLIWAHNACRFVHGSLLSRPDVIKCFDIQAAWIATMLAVWMKPSPKVLVGDYMPAVLVKVELGRWWQNILPRLFWRNAATSLLPSSRLFMAAEQISAFAKKTGVLDPGRLQLLPVDVVRYEKVVPRHKRGTIVSVGRLDHMKEYNLFMIDCINALVAEGRDVRWIVHGAGPLKNEMTRRILENNLEDRIELRGALDYSKMGEALAEAYIFVGMGTSAVEAAACGVPCAVAIAFDAVGHTLGPFWGLPPGNLGEPVAGVRPILMVDELRGLLSLGQDGYAEEQRKTRSFANLYSLASTMGTFMLRVEETRAPRKPWFLIVISYFAWLRNKLRDL